MKLLQLAVVIVQFGRVICVISQNYKTILLYGFIQLISFHAMIFLEHSSTF